MWGPAAMARFYEHREQRTEQLNVRTSRRLKLRVEKLARLWTYLERYQGGVKPADPEAPGGRAKGLPEVSLADVVNRLIAVSLDGAWAEWADEGGMGDVEPMNEAEWEALFTRARRRLPPPPGSGSRK